VSNEKKLFNVQRLLNKSKAPSRQPQTCPLAIIIWKPTKKPRL